MDKRPIGMFDSGIGGITVFSKVVEIIKNEDIMYIGDTKRFPYGSKTKEQIIQYSRQIVDKLVKMNVKLIVIACGTATSQAIDILKKEYNVPIIGVIEPTVNKIVEMKTSDVGVIGTKGTVDSGAWEKEILKVNKSINVTSVPCPLLAPLAEEGLANSKQARDSIMKYLSNFDDVFLEKLILGCTHYYLFRNFIEEKLGSNVEIIETGECLTVYLKRYLKENIINNENNRNGIYKIFLTNIQDNFFDICNNLLGDEGKRILKDINQIDVE